MRNVNDKLIKLSVRESIAHLISEAEKAFPKDKTRSKRYLKMAWALVRKNKVRLSDAQKVKFCRKCFILFILGDTAKIVFDSKHDFFEIVCGACGYKRRFR
jgi:RNase P subunit RPR2